MAVLDRPFLLQTLGSNTIFWVVICPLLFYNYKSYNKLSLTEEVREFYIHDAVV